MKILGTGLSGLVGSRIVELLQHKHDFENLSLETGVDITNKNEIIEYFSSSLAPVVFHLAAKADVDACEKDRMMGKLGAAWKINVDGTENIIEAAKKTKKKIFLVSTDFIFDGTHKQYSENDSPSPINWYGTTKYEAEKRVERSGLPFVIMRIAYPYRSVFEIKKDFVRAILDKLGKGEKTPAVYDHVMTPTFIDDIAFAFDTLINQNAEGIFHVVGNQFIRPYDAAQLIAKTFGKPSHLIEKTTRADYFSGRADRPLNLSINNDKIRELGIQMKTFSQGLGEIKKQMADIN